MPFLAIVDCRFFLDPLENLDINLVGVYIRFRCADMGIDFDTRVAESQIRQILNIQWKNLDLSRAYFIF